MTKGAFGDSPLIIFDQFGAFGDSPIISLQQTMRRMEEIELRESEKA
ncbi:MAG: hypothetical protein V1891_04720 [bacterium]